MILRQCKYSVILRNLVVEHAAAHKVALAARHVERGDGPAKAHGDDVRYH